MQPRQTTREQLRRVINPLDLVIITRDRLQEVVDEAVQRGRMTRGDAEEMVGRTDRRATSRADGPALPFLAGQRRLVNAIRHVVVADMLERM